jgi:hypothetical protein
MMGEPFSRRVGPPHRVLFWWSCHAAEWANGYAAMAGEPPRRRRTLRALSPDAAATKAWRWLNTGSPKPRRTWG